MQPRRKSTKTDQKVSQAPNTFNSLTRFYQVDAPRKRAPKVKTMRRTTSSRNHISKVQKRAPTTKSLLSKRSKTTFLRTTACKRVRSTLAKKEARTRTPSRRKNNTVSRKLTRRLWAAQKKRANRSLSTLRR